MSEDKPSHGSDGGRSILASGSAGGFTSSQNLDVALDILLESVHSTAYVGGYTHSFYRYPARFAPEFAKAAIETFTKAGETVLDPFMGGGTTAVESLLAGRRFIGCDINPLAVFLTRVKTTPLSAMDISTIWNWSNFLEDHFQLHIGNHSYQASTKYQRNVPWWLRRALQVAVSTLDMLPSKRQHQFARCSLLKTGQWALDCREKIPSTREFLCMHQSFVSSMLDSMAEYRKKLLTAFGTPPSSVSQHRRFVCRSAEGIQNDRRIPQSWLPPRLVLTSPPYPGVHVLYHRWQVQGRRETPAPYWLAACNDSFGASHYTFGDRKQKDFSLYMAQLRRTFSSIASLLDEESVVVQLVGFVQPEQQLQPYLEALRSCGLVEVDIGVSERIWRMVPHRKWYAEIRQGLSSTREVLLVHRKASAHRML